MEELEKFHRETVVLPRQRLAILRSAIWAARGLCVLLLALEICDGQLVAADLPSKLAFAFPIPVYEKPALGEPTLRQEAKQHPHATIGRPRTERPATKKAPDYSTPALPAPPGVTTTDLAMSKHEAVQPKGFADPEEFQLSPPTVDQLFRAESEATSRERIRRAAEMRKIKVVEFPKDALLPEIPTFEQPVGPMWQASFVAGAVCYHPLYFEQRLSEREGFFVLPFQPLLSAGHFYLDMILLPGRIVLNRPWQWECSIISTCR